MRTKADVQARVLEVMRQEGWNETDLARETSIPQATISRMLANQPSYKGSPASWRKLAQCTPLRLTEAEVLAAVGIGPPVPTDDEPDPWAAFEHALDRLPLSERHRSHLHWQAEVLLRDPENRPTGAPPPADTAPRSIRSRSRGN